MRMWKCIWLHVAAYGFHVLYDAGCFIVIRVAALYSFYLLSACPHEKHVAKPKQIFCVIYAKN